MDANFDPYPSFFKIMHGDLNFKKLRIPATFMKQYISKEVLSDKQAILKGPSGTVWKVKWGSSRGKTCLLEGWEDFVKDHNLEEGEFLVFRYYGDMRFEVQIFKKNGLMRTDVASSGGKRRPGKTKKMNTPEDFTSSNPHFVAHIRASTVENARILTIPKSFGMKHFPDHEIEVVLSNLKGESWKVTCYTYSKGKHTIRGAAWNAFIHGNNIKKGNVCIFELVAENEMLVHVFS